jgi:orotidine-5'-phosphate decarboxylase
MVESEAGARIFIALDYAESNFAVALAIARELGPEVAGMKVGPELHNNISWDRLSTSVRRVGARAIWLDENCLVGPDGMERIITQKCSANPPPDCITVSAFSGPDTIRAAVRHKHPDTKIIVATIDSHISDEQCLYMHGKTSTDKVLDLGIMAAETGADGVEISGWEIKALKDNPETANLTCYVTAIRSPGDPPHDQKRITTLSEALENGADFVVIGRPVTDSHDGLEPRAALNRMLGSLPVASSRKTT